MNKIGKKIIVIGCPGSGKSTFSRKLRDKTGIPLHYLDQIWHRPDKTNITREEFDEALRNIFNEECWIIDGNYIRTVEMRLKECDTVFLFDLPVELCIEGAQERVGKPREDMPWYEDKLDEEFRQFIIDFAEDTLPKIYELLEKYKEGKKIIIFKTRDEGNKFIEMFE